MIVLYSTKQNSTWQLSLHLLGIYGKMLGQPLFP